MSYRLQTDETLPEGLHRAAREQLDQAIRDLTENAEDNPVTAVHSARKAIKKERSLLRLTRGAMPGRVRRRENEALRAAAGALSGTRDADVMIETLDGLADRYAGQLPDAAFAAARVPLERAREAERASAQATALEAVAGELAAVRARAGEWPLDGMGWSEIARSLALSYERGRDARDRARRRGRPEDMHAWRKRVKDLWYQLRLLAPTGGPTIAGQAKDAHALADLLGDDHDLAVLRERLHADRAQVAGDLDSILALIDVRRGELRDRAFALGDRLYAESPRSFARRVRASGAAGAALAAVAQPDRPREVARATHVGAV